MKISRYILISATVLLIALSNTALSRPSISISIGSRHRNSHRNYRADYKRRSYKTSHRSRHHKSRWDRRHYRRHWRPTISRSVYRYDRKLGYCVAVTPMIIEKQTVVFPTSSSLVVQSQRFDENTLQLNINLQRKKIELLEQVQMSDKAQRIEAIRELAGFSFDDKVRYVLENILLSEPDSELRVEAAQALGNSNNIKALAVLEKARVEDSSEDVRKATNEAIKKLEGN